MSKTFKIELKETVTYFADIEADTIQEAFDKAQHLAANNEFPNGEQTLEDSVLTGWDGEKFFERNLLY